MLPNPKMKDANLLNRFPTTQWSIIARLQSSDGSEVKKAVEDIFNSYRYPLYGFLRSSGLNHEDAEDVLQDFFSKMLRTDGLQKADGEKGKLRTFLLTGLSRFHSNWRRDQRLRRLNQTAESELWSREEARWQRERRLVHDTPELFYDRQWATELVERARSRLAKTYKNRGRSILFETLFPLFLEGEQRDSEKRRILASRLGMTTNSLRQALHRLKEDFRECLTTEVKKTLENDGDIQAEISYLLGLFSSSLTYS